MKITFFDKIKTIFLIYKIIYRLPRFKTIVATLINPIDSIRSYEMAYIIKYIHENNLNFDFILDVSSPFILSYILSEKSKVIKSDINESEKYYILDDTNLSFKKEDALNLSFVDSNFDFIYSISVIEHIYLNYIKAIEEMVRVCKDGGYLYLTFPVSKNKMEEWLDDDIYSDQYTSTEGKVFFQYRFTEDQLKSIEKVQGLSLVKKDIFWERKDGDYDNMIRLLKIQYGNKYFTFLKNILINIYYGIFIFNESTSSFKNSKEFGNIHYIFKITK